ncbi:G kinase-anchoring protein 1 isoform X2 [Aethina tumida]|uniref:G kinase-anchoring protein 1 isoform X2 n=1 Tax=Aethina tumida TaxID=116153 RepID=UPI0021498C1D|nr:G kinase-anchoring protein 1 isoform X2 [Aethina tumida]
MQRNCGTDISVPSRFACLKIEDDEFRPVVNKNSKKKNDKKPTNANTNKKPNKQVTNGQQKKKSKAKQEDKQWEEWKKKDDELVNDHYQQDLQCAILQSKLEFEQKKRNPPVVQITEVSTLKKKKSKTMSLDEFLEQRTVNENVAPKDDDVDPNFFDKISATVKKELTKEEINAKRWERERNIDEVISLAQYQAKYEQEKEKNATLTKELEIAHKELAIVKARNATLCSLLSQGEMKDKASVLLELEKVTTMKEDLTEEVGKLHKLLEQERSKANANNGDKNKEKSKK